MSNQLITKTKENIDKANELFELRANINTMNKRKKELEEHFKLVLNAANKESLIAENILIVLKDAYTTLFNKKALQEDKGIDFVAKYQEQKEYKKLEIKEL